MFDNTARTKHPESSNLPQRDRFDDLALFYAECYLGREKVQSLLHGGDSPADPSPGFFADLKQRLRGLFGG
ncbi:MAG: hypothetical protein P1V97_11860 [Planctomycetota bacterium]|nr:hypothetical protein [Planctomycetota bacterium]